MEGFCPGGFCPGGFCPGGFCPRTSCRVSPKNTTYAITNCSKQNSVSVVACLFPIHCVTAIVLLKFCVRGVINYPFH